MFEYFIFDVLAIVGVQRVTRWERTANWVVSCSFGILNGCGFTPFLPKRCKWQTFVCQSHFRQRTSSTSITLSTLSMRTLRNQGIPNSLICACSNVHSNSWAWQRESWHVTYYSNNCRDHRENECQKENHIACVWRWKILWFLYIFISSLRFRQNNAHILIQTTFSKLSRKIIAL